MLNRRLFKPAKVFIFIGSISILLTSCNFENTIVNSGTSGSSLPPIPPNPALTAKLVQHCGECHVGSNKSGGIKDLDNLQWVAENYIVPANSSISMLYLNMNPGDMPKNTTAADYADGTDLAIFKAEIKEWIDTLDINTIDAKSFAEIYTDIFEPRCATCHSVDNPPAGIQLNSYTGILRVIEPGPLAETSLLYDAINQGRMPKAPNPLLDPDEIEEVLKWIQAGGAYDGITPATFTEVNTIIQAKCISCHGASTSRSLASHADVMAYVSSTVGPTGVAESTLYRAVQRQSGVQPMPRNNPALPNSEIFTIESWILDGAQDN